MIGILLITHGTFGESLVQNACHVLNKRPFQIAQFGVSAQDDPLDVLPRVRLLCKEVDTGEGVLILTDILGATPSNLAEFESRRADLERVHAEKLVAAQELATKLEGVTVKVARKAGMDGRLFGSVGNADVADGLVAQGFDIDRAAVRMPDGPLKQVGEVQLEVALHSDVVATITVVVVGEQ